MNIRGEAGVGGKGAHDRQTMSRGGAVNEWTDAREDDSISK